MQSNKYKTNKKSICIYAYVRKYMYYWKLLISQRQCKKKKKKKKLDTTAGVSSAKPSPYSGICCSDSHLKMTCLVLLQVKLQIKFQCMNGLESNSTPCSFQLQNSTGLFLLGKKKKFDWLV